MLILNLKTYPTVSGKEIVNVLELITRLIKKNPRIKSHLHICPATTDLTYIRTNFPSINVIAQHADPIEEGKSNGWTPAQLLKRIGIKMTLVNHSEHRLSTKLLQETLEFLNKNEVKPIVCCENLEEVKEVLRLKPFAIAYEAKELIGSGNSVSKQEPEIIEKFLKVCKSKTLPIIGAGISFDEDIRIGMEQGAKGFLVASAFAKSDEKEKKLLELLSPFLKSSPKR